MHNRRAAVELRRQRSRRPQAHAGAYHAAGRAVAVLAARSACHKAARGYACTGSKRGVGAFCMPDASTRDSAQLIARPLLGTSMQALPVAVATRAGAPRCCASQGGPAKQTQAAPQAGAALARRQALCAGAALTLGVQPRRANAAPALAFTSAAGLEYYDDKVGSGEEAAAGDVVKILYSAHTVNANGAFAHACSAAVGALTACVAQASWATSLTHMAALAPARARRTKSRLAIPTRTSR